VKRSDQVLKGRYAITPLKAGRRTIAVVSATESAPLRIAYSAAPAIGRQLILSRVRFPLAAPGTRREGAG
jgi:hypothetical protein